MQAFVNTSQSIKVAGGGTFGGSGAGGFSTGANQYAIMSIRNTNSETVTVGSAAFSFIAGTDPFKEIHVPPSTSVSWPISGSSWNVSWVIFENS